MSTISANDLQNTSGGIPTVKGQRLIPTAWVNFNGTGTVAIRDSENVSSITDVGVGIYDTNFAVALANTNYVIHGSVGQSGANPSNGSLATYPSSTASARMDVYSTSNTAFDSPYIGISIMGGQ
jgi:hypothetical protein